MITDRPQRESAVALAAAWLALMAAVLVGREVNDVGSFAVAGAIGAGLVFLGFAAASRCRTVPRRSNAHRTRLALLSLVLGTALGLANLAANWTIAEAEPRLRALLAERIATLDPLEAVVASPILEEVAVRLFFMSVLAWVVFRFTKRPTLAFAIAVIGSASLFALLHLARPFPGDPALATYYRAALMTKYTLAGVPLGWVFWRWGLPYSILCHAAGNAAHLALQGRVFTSL
jgi:Type II CAAX prenyl endopeptidase Rce1-like